ncbi:hypothetical protein [Alicyclobacillus ferrooxydans]|uniref:Uncharacterized protein n=1 Tax=Alicyclobacillus ferrooxydans TaxID=471514 RepID=A0A0P9CX70_9BACL|nr:hypothetical protein [Alicyclobacillus ferrooxydans]KPV44358.1 hypothetical protein AN477_06910 [Alicyclobacillus ferrooxydans]
MAVRFQGTEEILDLAVILTRPFRSLKSQQQPLLVDTERDYVSYTDAGLVIPRPTSLHQAVYDLLFVSLLQTYSLGTTDSPTFLIELLQKLADLIVERYKDQQVETIRLTIDERDQLEMPYGYVGVEDTHLRVVFLPAFIEIHTSSVTLIRALSDADGALIQKPFIDMLSLHYRSATGHFAARVKKKLLCYKSILNGEYVVHRHK